ncbi:HAD-IIIA family hydrolase [Limnobaculum xujianqingii]|uniref:HAD-IIIA family hydrolase n=1 Tax=Limnobaculum xujianqingii TaxID=2738837 RepID=UPI0011274CC3|nr:HAD-IIIA family hydrolase [Limnobaculum xujianqingii]
MKVEAVLFDLDNTLANTDILQDIRNRRAYEELTDAILNKVIVFEKGVEILKELKSMGVKIGVVTNSGRAYAERLLTYFKLNYFDVVITYTDVGAGGKKPSPDGILMALKQLNVSPSQNVWFVGDDYTDIEAAYRAGVKPIIPTWGPKNSVSQMPAAVLSSTFFFRKCRR